MKSGLPTNVDHVLMYVSFSSSIRTVLFVGLSVCCVPVGSTFSGWPSSLLYCFSVFLTSLSPQSVYTLPMFSWVCPLQLLRAVNLVWATQNIVRIIIFVRVYTQIFSHKLKFHFINMFMCASCGMFCFVIQLSRTLNHWGPMLLHMSFSCQAGQYRFPSAMVLSFILLGLLQWNYWDPLKPEFTFFFFFCAPIYSSVLPP